MNQPEKRHEHYTNALKYIDQAIHFTQNPTDLQFAKEAIQNELEQIKK